MTAPSPSNQQRAAEFAERHGPVAGFQDLNAARHRLELAVVAALDEAEARGRAEGLEQGRGDLEAWQRTCRAEGRAEAAAKIEALVAFYDRHEYSTLAVDDLRALAADLAAPADAAQP